MTESDKVKQLYNELLPLIEYEYNNISYIKLHKDMYDNMVVRVLKKAIKKGIYDYDELSNYFLDNLYVEIRKYLKQIIFNSNESLYIILDYISENFTDPDNIKEAIDNMRKLCNTLTKLDFNLTINLCFELIKFSKLLNKSLKIIIEENKDQIKKGNNNFIMDDFVFSCFVDSYCVKNNINYEFSDVSNITDDCKISQKNTSINDSVRVYLDEISKIPLLSKEQEKQIYERLLKNDRTAREELVNHNLRLVVDVAKRYVRNGISLLDLIQEGNLGLMKATIKYDPSLSSFSTYATWWIRYYIVRYIENNSRTIRIPVYMHSLIRSYNKARDKLSFEFKRIPTRKELANELNMPLSKIIEIEKSIMSVESLNEKFHDYNDSDDYERIEFVESDDDIELSAISSSISQEISSIFKHANLNERETKILILHYGLDDNIPKTFDRIASIFNVSKQRIEQIEKAAMGKIINSNYTKNYAVYTDNEQNSLDYLKNYKPRKGIKGIKRKKEN